MEKVPPPANPDAYVRSFRGWRRECIESLREAVKGAATFDEVIKWGHIVYFSNGPVLMLRGEPERMLFGFWRGRRLMKAEPRLKPGGKYEMATQEFFKGDAVDMAVAARLAKEAAALNRKLGDPTRVVKA